MMLMKEIQKKTSFSRYNLERFLIGSKATFAAPDIF